ncbi:MAG: hypothetical protein IJX64_07365 [Clostridia bacterium]|nr:hypothetical protein [Clostridia bacterium]
MTAKAKKILAVVVICLVIAALFVPFGIVHYDDGGTARYTSLTYSVVKWNKWIAAEAPEVEGGVRLEKYQNTCVYFFPNNFKSADALWEIKH